MFLFNTCSCESLLSWATLINAVLVLAMQSQPWCWVSQMCYKAGLSLSENKLTQQGGLLCPVNTTDGATGQEGWAGYIGGRRTERGRDRGRDRHRWIGTILGLLSQILSAFLGLEVQHRASWAHTIKLAGTFSRRPIEQAGKVPFLQGDLQPSWNQHRIQW